MSKRILAGWLAGGLVAGILAASLLATAFSSLALGRYPGAQLYGTQKVVVQGEDGRSISRQVTYQTTDELAVVRPWFAKQFGVSPASEYYFGGDCFWANKVKDWARVTYSASVLLCKVPHGTRISINQSVGLRP
jgi:hypothetical protein